MMPEHFIHFLRKHCHERIVGSPAFFERDYGRDEAYRDIIQHIEVYEANHKERDAA